jgi:tetratricopeptide (TPR) repeat protein
VVKKNRVIFLPVPEGLRKQLTCETQNGFKIDPDIPIPVEISEDNKEFIPENLSMEMILTGMLRAIEEREVEHKWIDYYCNFVIYLRPEILTEIKKYRDNAFNDENYIKANKLIREGKAGEGLSIIRDFIERHPLVWNGWFMLGWALRLLGRWADGEAAFRKTIDLGGDNSDTRNELAICLMENGDITGAKQELKAALKADPENEKIISNLQVVEDVICKKRKAENN